MIKKCNVFFSERRTILKNILKRGTVLLLAIMMIMTCGAFNMTYVHADNEIKTLKVKVVDGSGNPMPGIEMEFYNQYSQDYPTFTTDENGVGTFTIDPDNPVLFTGEDYEVKPASPGYKSIDTTVVTIGGFSDEAYFEKVNDEDYTGDTVTVGIKEQSFKITVNGGSANVTESAPGKTITISADSTGYEFSKWTDKTGKLKFKNANLAKTEFTMPASDVTITANFTKNRIAKFTAGSRWDEYLEGDTFKLKDAKVEDPDGNIKSVNTDLVTVEPDRPLTAADKEVTASYSGFSVTIPVNVKKKVDWPVSNDLPANQPKDIWETATERVSDIGVTGAQGNASGLKFVFYDVTTQDPKDTIEVATDESGYLTDINLKRDHNYLIYLKSDEYFMQNVYGWVHDGRLMNIKEGVTQDPQNPNKAIVNYPIINNLTVVKSTQSTTSNYSRYTTAIPVEYNGKAMPGIKFRLVSPVETLEATTDENGILKADLLEDVNYMVSVESDKYAVEAFPLAIKDKSEYRMDKYAYDHSDCQGVGPRYIGKPNPLQLVDKGTERKNDKTITSVSGDTTISGMNFKDIYCVEKKMDTKVSGLSDGTYDVYDIEAMNPHRSEVSKLAAGDFTVTEKTRTGVKVKAVYMLGSDGKLKALSFKQTKSGEPVTFKADSIGVNNVVIQYYDSLGKYTDVMGHGAVWNKGGNTPYIAKFENTDPTKNDETIDNFMGISIDGKELVRDQDYVAKAGSVITEIRPEYMETLGAGTHTLTAYFMDGDPVSVNFTVKVAAAEDAGTGAGHSLTGTTVTKVSVVKTGDSFSWTPVFMFMAAVIALAVVVVFEKRRKQQR